MTSAIVVGGGIAGCSTAYALAKRGIDVVLIERQPELAQAGSGNPVAMLYPKLSALPDTATLLGTEGFKFSLDLLRLLDKDNSFHACCGQLQLAFDTKTKDQHHKIAQHPYFQQLPFPAQFVDAAKASAIAGIEVKHGGLYLPEGGWVKPHTWCKTLTTQPNIRTILDTAALSLEPQTHGWRVHAARQAFEAEHLVLCNAFDAIAFLPHLKPHLTSVRGQINYAQPTAASATIQTVLCAQHFISPAVDGWHTLGTTYANHDMTPYCTEQDTQSILHGLQEINADLPEMLDPDQTPGRVGWRCATADYLPLVGQMLDIKVLQAKPPRPGANSDTLPWLQGLYINIGHGSKGMITAPLCGDWLAGLLIGEARAHTLLSALQPNRFALRMLGLKRLAQHIYA